MDYREDINEETTEDLTSKFTTFVSNVRRAIIPTAQELYDQAVGALAANPIKYDVVKACFQKLVTLGTVGATLKVLLLYYGHIKKNTDLNSWYASTYSANFKNDQPSFLTALAPEMQQQVAELLVQEINDQFGKLKIGYEGVDALAYTHILLKCAVSEGVQKYAFLKDSIASTRQTILVHAVTQMFWNIVKNSTFQEYLIDVFDGSNTQLFFDIFLPFIDKPQQLTSLNNAACEQFAKIYLSQLDYLRCTGKDFDDAKQEEVNIYYRIVLGHGVSLKNTYCMNEYKRLEKVQKKMWRYTEISAYSLVNPKGEVVAQTWQSSISDRRVSEILNLLNKNFEHAASLLDQKLIELDAAMELREKIIYKIYEKNIAKLILNSDFHTEVAPERVTVTHMKRSLLAHVVLRKLGVQFKIDYPTQVTVSAPEHYVANLNYLHVIYTAGLDPLGMGELSLFISALKNLSDNKFFADALMTINPCYEYLYAKQEKFTHEESVQQLLDDIQLRLTKLHHNDHFTKKSKDQRQVFQLLEVLFTKMFTMYAPTLLEFCENIKSCAWQIIQAGNVTILSDTIKTLLEKDIDQEKFFQGCNTLIQNAAKSINSTTSLTMRSVPLSLAAASASINLAFIPREIWEKITHYLSIRDQYSLASTCQFFFSKNASPINATIKQEWQRNTLVSISANHTVICAYGTAYVNGQSIGKTHAAHSQITSVRQAIKLPSRACLVETDGDTFFILTFNRELYAFGKNNYGQCGVGHTRDINKPELVLINEPVEAVVARGESAFAITHCGKLYAWGRNHYGQLGLCSTIDTHTPVRVHINERVKSITNSGTSFFAATHNGEYYGWGKNDCNQLVLSGLGKWLCDQPGPSRLSIGAPDSKEAFRIQSIETVNASVFALTDGGKLYSWGDSSTRLGIEACRASSKFPQLVHINEPLQSVIALNYCVFAIAQQGTLYAWGDNNHGQLGMGLAPTDVIVTPHIVQIGEPVQSVVAAYDSVFAIARSGKLYAWGNNKYGQLGLGHTNAVNTPALVSMSYPVAWVVTNYGSTFIFDTQNNLYACGDNRNNRLGLITDATETPSHYVSLQKVDYDPAPKSIAPAMVH